eukprot:SAG31_NODE_91_length_26366_cov_6.792211_11_plen_284_part_00
MNAFIQEAAGLAGEIEYYGVFLPHLPRKRIDDFGRCRLHSRSGRRLRKVPATAAGTGNGKQTSETTMQGDPCANAELSSVSADTVGGATADGFGDDSSSRIGSGSKGETPRSPLVEICLHEGIEGNQVVVDGRVAPPNGPQTPRTPLEALMRIRSGRDKGSRNITTNSTKTVQSARGRILSPRRGTSPRSLAKQVIAVQPWFARNADGGNGPLSGKMLADSPRFCSRQDVILSDSAHSLEQQRSQLFEKQAQMLPPVQMRSHKRVRPANSQKWCRETVLSVRT